MKLGKESVTVIQISAIQAVVAMIPHKLSQAVDKENRYVLSCGKE